MIRKTIAGIEYILIPVDDIRNLFDKPEVLTVPEWDEFKAYALENRSNIDIGDLQIKYKAWKEARWTDGKGKKIKNWKTKLLHTLPHIKESKDVRREIQPIPKDIGVPSKKAMTRAEYLASLGEQDNIDDIGKHE